MSLLKWLSNVSPFRGLPVDDKKTSGTSSSTSTETVQLYYNNSGTLTSDAGQAAGTVVVGKLSYSNVRNKLGAALGKYGDSSLSFTSTALTTEVGIETITPSFLEGLDESSWSVRMDAIGAKLSNGQYFVDYAMGIIYGKKTSTTTTLTSTTYTYGASVGGGVSAVDNAAFTVSTSTTTPMAALVDEVSTGSVTEGNTGVVRMTATRELRNAETYAPAAEDNVVGVLKVEERFSYSNITSATTTTVKSGAGFVHAITVNTTAAGTITIYDNTAGSGTKIATLKASVAEQTFFLNASFGTGLTIVTAAASDVTVSYR